MPDTLDTRLAAFASSLREAGAIRSDTITVPQNALPGGEVLDLIYSHQSLLTSTGHNGQPPSSSSAPTLMARMLDTAQGAAESIRRLGLDHRVTVRHGNGYLGEPSSGPYDRIIVTCGVAGLSPHWLGQLAPDGRIVAPIAHGGVHPVLVTTAAQGTVRGNAALLDSSSVGGAELVVQGPDRCWAVGGWQGGEVGFQPAQHQRAAAGADGGQPAQRGEPGGYRPVEVTGRDVRPGQPRCVDHGVARGSGGIGGEADLRAAVR